MDSKSLSIAQVVEITGLPASTIRYYDQQLGEFLGIQRGKGRRRDFSTESVAMLQKVHSWLKDDGLSIRQVRANLDKGVTGANREVDDLAIEVADLRREVNELKDIQKRMLDILSGMGR